MSVQKICVEKNYPELHKTPTEKEKDFAAFLRSRVWPLGTSQNVAFMNTPEEGGVVLVPAPANARKSPLQIKYEGLQREGKLDIKKAIQEIVETEYNPILDRFKFVFVDDVNKANIRIKFDKAQGSYSVIGREAAKVPKNQPTMNFAWFDVGTVLHEFGHALGLIHEHQNPKGNDIKWNVSALNSYMKTTQGWDSQQVNDQVIQKYKRNQINGSNFDPDSIMLYFYPADLTENNVGTTQNRVLSETDKKTIADAYSADSTVDTGSFRVSWIEEHLVLLITSTILAVILVTIAWMKAKSAS
jgi:hypothetical protein